MQTDKDIYTTFLDGWVVRLKRPAEQAGKRVALLIHGWTGDESVMWIFARSLPADTWILAPRGPVKAPEGGYGWITPEEHNSPNYSSYARSALVLFDQLESWLAYFKIAPPAIDLMGFSMGAAMAYTLLIERPQKIGRVAGLAGFLPPESDRALSPGMLTGKQVFIAHGTRDETIPVDKARQSAEALEASGANVTYCEENVGHKLGANCNKGLTAFFKPR